MRALVCLVLLLAVTEAGAAPGITIPPALGTPREVRVAGRVVASVPAEDAGVLRRNLSALAARNVVGVPVEVRLGDQRARTITAHDGEFEITVPASTKPFTPGRHLVEVHAQDVLVTSEVHVIADDAPFLVLSDFDDTVAITNVTSKRGLAKAALLQDGTTQPGVDGMAALFRCLLGATPAAGLAFVSGSPIQFASRLETFLALHDFPSAGLYLRNLGAGTLSGYKQPIIRRLLTQFSQPIVLVGDSGEHDPEVFAQIRREFPGRVKRIYIRDAGRSEDASRFEGMLLFRDAREVALDAVSRGLTSPACIDRAFPVEGKDEAAQPADSIQPPPTTSSPS